MNTSICVENSVIGENISKSEWRDFSSSSNFIARFAIYILILSDTSRTSSSVIAALLGCALRC